MPHVPGLGHPGPFSLNLGTNVAPSAPIVVGQTIDVGQTLETDLAQAVASIHLVLVNQITEADLAQQVKLLHLRAVGQIIETELAQQIKLLHVKSVLQTTETELSQQIKLLHIRSVGQATETNLAQHIGEIQQVTESQAPETDLAQAIKPLHVRTVGQTTETELAQHIAAIHRVLVNQTNETDLAQQIGNRQLVQALQADSTEQALAVGVLQQGASNVALFVPEVGLPFVLVDAAFDAFILTSSNSQVIDVGQANEVELAQLIGFVNVVPIVELPQVYGSNGSFSVVSRPVPPKLQPRTIVVTVELAQEFDSAIRIEGRKIFRPIVVPKFAESYFYTTSVKNILLEENELELVLAGII